MTALRVLLAALALAPLPFAALFAFQFWDRYWRHRDCFNELGRCWHPVEEEVFMEGAGLVWGGLTATCLLVAGLSSLAMRALGRRSAAGDQ